VVQRAHGRCTNREAGPETQRASRGARGRVRRYGLMKTYHAKNEYGLLSDFEAGFKIMVPPLPASRSWCPPSYLEENRWMTKVPVGTPRGRAPVRSVCGGQRAARGPLACRAA
jgi:hypothetical protein